MNNFKLNGLKIIENFSMNDERGSFEKSFINNTISEEKFISEVLITKSKKGVIRGLHFQTKNPQDKIISVINGEVLDVAVDIRSNSNTFGEYESIILNGSDHKSFYIPAGFAHGFQVLSEEATVMYCCIGDYDKETDNGIIFNDKEINIKWIDCGENIISKKDSELQTLSMFKRDFGGL